MRILKPDDARKAARLALIAMLSLVAGCATLSDATNDIRLQATHTINKPWASDNDATRAAHGSRTVKASVDQTWRASRAAMARIGLEIIGQGSLQPNVKATKFLKGGTWPWGQAVRDEEESRMRQAFRAALGPKGFGLLLTPGDQTLTATSTSGPGATGGTQVSVDFRSVQSVGCKAHDCITEIPPAALRAAYFEYWTAFDDELNTILADDSPRRTAVAGPRAKPHNRHIAKPPSDWVLPPSGWKTPPS